MDPSDRSRIRYHIASSGEGQGNSGYSYRQGKASAFFDEVNKTPLVWRRRTTVRPSVRPFVYVCALSSMSDYNHLSDFRDIPCSRHLQESCQATVCFANRISDNRTILKAQIHSCTAFPYSLTHLGKIRNKIQAIPMRK